MFISLFGPFIAVVIKSDALYYYCCYLYYIVSNNIV